MALAAEAALAAAAFLPPTVVMGALFTHLQRRARRRLGFLPRVGLQHARRRAGALRFRRARGSAFGAKPALLSIAAAIGCSARGARCAAADSARLRPPRSRSSRAAAARFVDVPQGGRLVSYHEGVLATVTVIEDSRGVARLRINNRQQEGAAPRSTPTGGRLCCRCCCTPRRSSVVPGARHGRHCRRGRRAGAARGRRRRALARGRGRSRLLHGTRGRRHAPRGLQDRHGRCAPLRASDGPALRRHRFRQLSSRAERLRGAVHRRAFRRRARAARGRRPVLSVAAAASARSRDAAQHRAHLSRGFSRGRRCSPATASKRRCSGSSPRPATAACGSTTCERGSRRRNAKAGASKITTSATSSRCSGRSSRVRARSRFAGFCAAEHG